MKILLFSACLLVSCILQANRTMVTAPEATIRLLSLTGDVATFEVKLTNRTDAPIFVEESRQGYRDLHVVSVDIEVKAGRWDYVGPKMDSVAASVFDLPSGQSVTRNISVYSLGKDYLRLLKAPQPKYRARLRYFSSQEVWLSFAKSLGREPQSQPSVLIALPSGGD
jgi:hypothetical protein